MHQKSNFRLRYDEKLFFQIFFLITYSIFSNKMILVYVNLFKFDKSGSLYLKNGALHRQCCPYILSRRIFGFYLISFLTQRIWPLRMYALSNGLQNRSFRGSSSPIGIISLTLPSCMCNLALLYVFV